MPPRDRMEMISLRKSAADLQALVDRMSRMGLIAELQQRHLLAQSSLPAGSGDLEDLLTTADTRNRDPRQVWEPGACTQSAAWPS